MIRDNLKRLIKGVIRRVTGNRPSEPAAQASPTASVPPVPTPPVPVAPDPAPVVTELPPADEPVLDAAAVQAVIDAHAVVPMGADGSVVTVTSVEGNDVVLTLSGRATASASARATTGLALERLLQQELDGLGTVQVHV